jgi:hypothetical protein
MPGFHQTSADIAVCRLRDIREFPANVQVGGMNESK